MRVSYQHANPRRGNESTVLRFTDDDGSRVCVLVDAGEGVDADELLAADEELDAIVLTHAHIDHYRSLGKNVEAGVPVYASAPTAAALERALPEARKDNDVGDVDVALEALEPIDGWTDVGTSVAVRPVPAGHAPGAAGFVCRFDDDASGPLGGERHLLVTGDFTRRPCAGYPGLPVSYPFEVDAVLLNVSTAPAYETTLEDSLRTVLERAYAGSRVVVATGSLTGVHYAALLGRVADALDRPLPVTIVGQAARLYEALGYDVAGVEAYEVFDRPSEVLEPGRVTIAGPEAPTTGSAERLLGAIADDPGDCFVQLAAGDGGSIDGTRCTTRAFGLSNHPTDETIDALVRELAPLQVVLKHATGDALRANQGRFDRCFVWGTTDARVSPLYEDGQWVTPEWIGEQAARRIRQGRWEALQERPPDPAASLPGVERGPIDPAAEGVDLEALSAAFGGSASDPYADATAATDGNGAAVDDATAATDDATAATDGSTDATDDATAATDGSTDATDGATAPANPRLESAGSNADDWSATAESGADAGSAAEESGASAGSATAESGPDDATASADDAAGDRASASQRDGKAFERAVLERLAEIEHRLNGHETVRARVLDGGDERILRLLDDAAVEPGEVVEIAIERRVSTDESA